MDIIISVAALDSQGQLGKFSNWATVDIGAPGVKFFPQPLEASTLILLSTFLE